MTEELGNEISEECLSFLRPETKSRRNLVLILLTIGETGFPHVCLLSPYQVVSRTRSELCFEVYPSSRTKRNLDSARKATLIIPESTALLYASGETEHLIDLIEPSPQSVYTLKVSSVLRDGSEDAPINSQMTFDASVIGLDYQKGFDAMLMSLESKKTGASD